MISKELLKEFTIAVRQSTLKRLLKVPDGYEHWKLSENSLSFAEIAQHLIDIDEWTIQKINNSEIKSIETLTAEMNECNRAKFIELIEDLKNTLDKKLELFESLNENDLNKKIYDDSYNIEMSLSMLILRRNLDHETHHRGQLATYLRVIEDL